MTDRTSLFMKHLKTLYPLKHTNLEISFPDKLARAKDPDTKGMCSYSQKNKIAYIEVLNTGIQTELQLLSTLAHEYRHAMYRDKGIPYVNREEIDATMFGRVTAARWLKSIS